MIQNHRFVGIVNLSGGVRTHTAQAGRFFLKIRDRILAEINARAAHS
jgi:hypothetical protein